MGVISEIRLKDNYSAVANKVVSSLGRLDSDFKKVEKSSRALKSALPNTFGRTYEVKIKDVGNKKIRSDLQKLNSELRSATKGNFKVNISAKTSRIDKLKSSINNIKSNAKDIKVGISGYLKASSEAKKLARDLKKTTGKKHKISLGIEGGGKVASVLDGIKEKLKGVAKGLGGGIGGAFKLGGKAMLAGGLGAAGAGILGAKTLWSQGSELEAQKISMTHFLGGDQKKSDEYLSQLRGEANKTPFGTDEVISAGTRAIQIAEGDTTKGMELVKMAEDMAALTPGKTISDAMEALADMQMGEMERMKEFGFKGSKEEFDKAGGDITKMKSSTGKTIGELFTGGAEKLSKSGKGRLETIKGNVQSGLADAGLKMLEKLSPALEKLIPVSEKIGTLIPQAFDMLMAKIGPIFQSISSAITPMIPTIQSIASGIMPLFSSALSTVGGIIQNLVMPAFSVIGSIVQSVVLPGFNLMANFLTGMVNPALNGLGSIVQGLLVPIFNFFVGVVSKAVSIFNSLVGAISTAISAFKGIGGKISGAISGIKGFFGGKKNANGTSYFGGGITKINERGEELIDLPRGSRIYPQGKSEEIIKRDLTSNNSRSSNVTINPTIYISGGDPKENGREVERALRRLAVNV